MSVNSTARDNPMNGSAHERDRDLFESATPVKQVHWLVDDEAEEDEDDDATVKQDSPSRSAPSPSHAGYRDEESSYYPPVSIKSNVQSREHQFDLDSDEIEPGDNVELDESSDEPLLRMDGLIKTNAQRRSIDLNGHAMPSAFDEAPPDWLIKGGGVAASIANMANSILSVALLWLLQAGD